MKETKENESRNQETDLEIFPQNHSQKHAQRFTIGLKKWYPKIYGFITNFPIHEHVTSSNCSLFSDAHNS